MASLTTRDARLRQLIREYRVLRGLSQADVAALMNVNVVTYRRYEAGRSTMNRGRVNRLAKICRAIGLDQATLLREAGFEALKEDEL